MKPVFQLQQLEEFSRLVGSFLHFCLCFLKQHFPLVRFSISHIPCPFSNNLSRIRFIKPSLILAGLVSWAPKWPNESNSRFSIAMWLHTSPKNTNLKDRQIFNSEPALHFGAGNLTSPGIVATRTNTHFPYYHPYFFHQRGFRGVPITHITVNYLITMLEIQMPGWGEISGCTMGKLHKIKVLQHIVWLPQGD